MTIMQPCLTCQYESPSGAKFCRQCGAPLVADNEFSGAATRNYGRQGPAPAVAVSAPLPPSISDVISADTARQYHQPPVYAAPSISTAPIKKSYFKFGGRRAGQMFLLLLALFVGLAIGLLHSIDNPDTRTPEQLAEQEAITLLHAHQQEQAEMIRNAQEQALAAQASIRAAQEQARDRAQQAAEAGAALAPSDIHPLDLGPYEYPGASLGSYSRIPGNEMTQSKTKDAFDTIIQFYQKKLGKPLMLMNDEDEKNAFFQSSTAPGIFVSIEEDDDNNGFWRITITRAPFLFPQLAAAPAPLVPVKP
jgi:hypothetical protein